MLAYRVFFHDPGAKSGKSGHARYLHRPQGKGRWDNPDLYDSWYLARSPEGAIGEAFGNLARFSASMFDTPSPNMRRALATFSIPDDVAVFDFDDPTNLQAIAMRPSEVVIRNAPATQRRAAALHAETRSDGSRRWQALQWWSYHHPRWTNLMLWSSKDEPAALRLEEVEQLDVKTPCVVEAAETLMRPRR